MNPIRKLYVPYISKYEYTNIPMDTFFEKYRGHRVPRAMNPIQNHTNIPRFRSRDLTSCRVRGCSQVDVPRFFPRFSRSVFSQFLIFPLYFHMCPLFFLYISHRFPHISSICPIDFPYMSPIFPLYFPYISIFLSMFP